MQHARGVTSKHRSQSYRKIQIKRRVSVDGPCIAFIPPARSVHPAAPVQRSSACCPAHCRSIGHPSSGRFCKNETRVTMGRKAFRCWRKCPAYYACAAKRYMCLAMFPPRLPNRAFPCISCIASLATHLPHTCHTFATHLPHSCHMRFLVRNSHSCAR